MSQKSIEKYIYKEGDLTLKNDIKANYGISFVRKYLSPDENREYLICKEIKKYQDSGCNMNNVVKILNVTKKYYDQEFLTKVDKIDFKVKKAVSDIKKGIIQLNKLGIIYLDLKEDNLGYSENDKKWKIFDFDSSGVYLYNKWIIEPPYYKKKALELSDDPNLIDKIMLNNLVEKAFKNV